VVCVRVCWCMCGYEVTWLYQQRILIIIIIILLFYMSWHTRTQIKICKKKNSYTEHFVCVDFGVCFQYVCVCRYKFKLTKSSQQTVITECANPELYVFMGIDRQANSTLSSMGLLVTEILDIMRLSFCILRI